MALRNRGSDGVGYQHVNVNNGGYTSVVVHDDGRVTSSGYEVRDERVAEQARREAAKDNGKGRRRG